MSNYGAGGGKPLHCFRDFVQVDKNIKINQSNCLAIFPSIGKHLSECENFKITYPDEINYVKENIEARKQRTNELLTTNNLKRQLEMNQFQNLQEISQNYLDETEDDRASFTTHSIRTDDTDTILKESAKNIQENIEIAAKEDKYSISILLDGWKNVIKQHILGLVIIRSDGQVLIWKAKDISEDRENTKAAIKQINEFLVDTKAKNVKINTVITDSASSYNAAW
ncbi:hypothetical protein RclHR1_02210002 [Rhizophagus clarus]|uniref:Uncharacterized protein n=1 Tax=Rhizophagus clarus TaxID=94130 RepID=A0A2Z6QTX8_9GLOM|nr:hypothetical protein RclHR1_02210002 [Rhizophagus clarus]GET00178.1 hypothetical protein GLOIN_2v473602 [Rhizophagus clarus]